jgi:type 1 fimbria pilin
MKKFKISMLAVVAIVMGIAASAFTNLNVPQNYHAMHYIRYDGTDNSNGQIEASSNWVDLGTQEPALSCSDQTGVVCFVKYNGDLASFQTYVSDKTVSDLETAGIIQAFREE